MKHLILSLIPIAMLAAGPAVAHPGTHVVPHGQEPSLLAVMLGLGLASAFAGFAVRRAAVK